MAVAEDITLQLLDKPFDDDAVERGAVFKGITAQLLHHVGNGQLAQRRAVLEGMVVDA